MKLFKRIIIMFTDNKSPDNVGNVDKVQLRVFGSPTKRLTFGKKIHLIPNFEQF